MAPMQDVYLVLLAQMFMTWTVLMEQYSQLWTHIHGSELPTQSKAAAVIFSQSTTGEASNEEAMSCDDEVSVMPPPALKLLSSGQTLRGTALCKVLAPQTPAPLGQHSVLEKLFSEVPSQRSWAAVPMPHTWTHSTESQESRGSTGSKWKVHPS